MAGKEPINKMLPRWSYQKKKYYYFWGPKWEDQKVDIPWVLKAREVAKSFGIAFIYDPNHHWEESMEGYVPYLISFEEPYPHFFFENKHVKFEYVLFIGGKGKPPYCCSAFLHELAHSILSKEKHHPKELEEGEKSAWALANKLADQYRLPLVSAIRRRALYEYHYIEICISTKGSKHKSPHSPNPPYWRLMKSKRSAKITTPGIIFPGQRSKRFLKKKIKNWTIRKERHERIPEE